jgi:hypothetical protein
MNINKYSNKAKSACIIQKSYRNTDICGICLCLVQKKSGCCHHFHDKCFETYSNSKCPICKKIIFTELQYQKWILLNKLKPNYLKSITKIFCKYHITAHNLCNIAIKESLTFLATKNIVLDKPNLIKPDDLISSILNLDNINQYIEPNQLLPGTNKWSIIDHQLLKDIILVLKYTDCLYFSNYDFNYMNRSSLEHYKRGVEIIKRALNKLPYQMF